MSYIENIRQSIFSDTADRIIYAVTYSRVSTDNDGQKDSCANQIEMAEHFINEHPNIKLVRHFVDDGLSGKNGFNRPQYQAMLETIKSGKIDLIITKSLSRLNRDQRNQFELTDILKNHEATIYTLDNASLYDLNELTSSILFGIMASMDAQVVHRQSRQGKLTHEQRCRRKELSAKDIAYGYCWNAADKTISIVPEQAMIVTSIYEDYVYRNATPASIHKTLQNRGIKISDRTVSNILSDERYIGNFHINKRSSVLGTGTQKTKRIKLPKEEWILVEQPHLQIIEKELFEAAQKLREARCNFYNNPEEKASRPYFQGTHTFSGKIFCACCGKPYHYSYTNRSKTKAVYRIKRHSDCENPVNRILETEIEKITQSALKAVISQQEEVCTSLEKLLTDCIRESNDSTEEISRLKKQKAAIERRTNALVDALAEGGLTVSAREHIKTKLNDLVKEIEALTADISVMEASQIDDSYVNTKIQEIREAISELRNFEIIDRERILNYIERYIIYKNRTIDVILKSGNTITVVTTKEGYSAENTLGKTRIQDALCSLPEACL